MSCLREFDSCEPAWLAQVNGRQTAGRKITIVMIGMQTARMRVGDLTGVTGVMVVANLLGMGGRT
jgi:hypothetical protein